MPIRTQDFIQLPSLSEAGTLTLVEELEAVAKTTPKVPSSVFGALGNLLTAYNELKAHIAVRERAGSTADPRARAADRALDDAWGAFQSWLLGWTHLPDRAHPRVKDARALYRRLFPKGLQFLTLDFKDEWKESQERLDVIVNERIDELIDALGGAAFLATISRAHRAYGEALLIAPSGRTEEPDAPVRASLAATHLALRDYVARVAATVQRHDPESVALAAALLEPISERTHAAVDDTEQAEEACDDDTIVSVSEPA